MRDDRVRTGILACVALFVPRVDVVSIPIRTATVDKEGCDHDGQTRERYAFFPIAMFGHGR